jgi:uncharacterized protein DUF2397
VASNVLYYVTTEKAALYAAVMRAFMESKARFRVHLQLPEICDLVQIANAAEIESALAQLVEWGNLQMIPDRAGIRTTAEFYNPRHLFQVTSEGEAAERALELYREALERKAELPCTALIDIVQVLRELKHLLQQREPDAGQMRRNLLLVRMCFEDLTATAQMLVRRLEERTGVHPADARRLIEYAEQFLADLVLAQDSIAEILRDGEGAGIRRVLSTEWDRLQDWFIAGPGRSPNADLLRERVRASIPALLAVIARINDQQLYRIDRSTDFRVLARWFAEAQTDAEAHRLWRTVFGLCPARHLTINDATLDDHEARHVPADTSWLDAPPVRISMRARAGAGNSQTGMLSRMIDRTAEKEKLAAAVHEEALRILSAQARFGSGRRMRLSELEQLEAGEFDLFLDLLGEAVSMEILSGNGYLRVKLERTDDGREASIVTTEGTFCGPDHWISIEQISDQDAVGAPEEVV